jgi:hypothetical protein
MVKVIKKKVPENDIKTDKAFITPQEENMVTQTILLERN